MQWLRVGLFIACCWTQTVWAVDSFEEADALFAKIQLEQDRGEIAAARKAYLSLASADPLRSLDGVGRVAFFEGYLYPGEPALSRKKIFAQCKDIAESLKSVADGQTHHHTWKTICTALWFTQLNLLERALNLSDLQNYLKQVVDSNLELREGLVDERYLGGGILRMLAGIYINDAATTVLAALNTEGSDAAFRRKLNAKALEFTERAQELDAYPGSELVGGDYYGNYRVQAEVLIRMERYDEALVVLEDAIAEVDELREEGDVVITTLGEQLRMKNLKKQLEGR